MTPGRGIEWGRVVVSGLVAGLAWTILSITLLALLGDDFIRAAPHPRPGRFAGPFLLLSNFLAALWAMWLYAAIRAQFGNRIKTALIAGLAWWFIVSLQSGKWVALGFVPPEAAWVPFAATLPAILLSALTGAWIFERARRD